MVKRSAMGMIRRNARAFWGVGLACGWLAGCLPSAFEALEESRERASQACDAGLCWSLDAGWAEPPLGDASLVAPSRPDGATPTPVAPDAAACALGWCEDASRDDVVEPDAAAWGEDAGDDAGSVQEDAGDEPPPPVCGGNPPACEPGQEEPQQEACGACNTGVRTRSRSCAPDGCSWGDWSEWSACGGVETQCTPGAAETRSVSCTTCGSKQQRRTCSTSTCTWSGWEDTSDCSWCEQCSEVVYCDTPASIANRGTWCRQKACSRQQADDDCKEDVKNICGATIQPFYMEYL